LLFILIYHHRIVFLLFGIFLFYTTTGGWSRRRKKAKREKGRFLFVVHDSPQPLVKNSHSHTKKASNDVTHFLKPTPHTHYCIIIFTVGIYLRTDRYLKEYSIEREIWSIDRRRTDERARKTTTWRRFGTHFRR